MSQIDIELVGRYFHCSIINNKEWFSNSNGADSACVRIPVSACLYWPICPILHLVVGLDRPGATWPR
jgi:hypothetical protein